MAASPEAALPRADRLRLSVQREIARLLAPLLLPFTASVLRFGLGYRVEGIAESRRAYAALRRGSPRPLLICANHLTMIDSFIIGWALGSPGFYLRHFSSLPWNVPERTNFAVGIFARIMTYLFKCLPIERGGQRSAVARTLARFTCVISRGEVGLVFPEAGRSRSGRVEVENAAYGVGRILAGVPGCEVLCVYLRGERQATFSALPARGDRFRIAMAPCAPSTSHRGVRGSLHIARQITAKLAEMEHAYFGEAAEGGDPPNDGRPADAAEGRRETA